MNQWIISNFDLTGNSSCIRAPPLGHSLIYVLRLVRGSVIRSDKRFLTGLAAWQCALAAQLVALPRRGLLGVHGVDG